MKIKVDRPEGRAYSIDAGFGEQMVGANPSRKRSESRTLHNVLGIANNSPEKS